VDGRRGPQVLSLQLLDPAPSVSRARRQKPDEMAGMVEDLIRLLDDASNGLRQGRYPGRGHSQKISTVMRAVAEDRKSTRLNSSHVSSSYAGFSLKKKTSHTPLPRCRPRSARAMLLRHRRGWS